MRILEKRSKKQIILIPETKAEKKLITDIPEDKFSKMKVLKGKMTTDDFSIDKENVLILSELH